MARLARPHRQSIPSDGPRWFEEREAAFSPRKANGRTRGDGSGDANPGCAALTRATAERVPERFAFDLVCESRPTRTGSRGPCGAGTFRGMDAADEPPWMDLRRVPAPQGRRLPSRR